MILELSLSELARYECQEHGSRDSLCSVFYYFTVLGSLGPLDANSECQKPTRELFLVRRVVHEKTARECYCHHPEYVHFPLRRLLDAPESFMNEDCGGSSGSPSFSCNRPSGGGHSLVRCDSRKRWTRKCQADYRPG